jgi:hypothetical protein
MMMMGEQACQAMARLEKALPGKELQVKEEAAPRLYSNPESPRQP